MNNTITKDMSSSIPNVCGRCILLVAVHFNATSVLVAFRRIGFSSKEKKAMISLPEGARSGCPGKASVGAAVTAIVLSAHLGNQAEIEKDYNI